MKQISFNKTTSLFAGIVSIALSAILGTSAKADVPADRCIHESKTYSSGSEVRMGDKTKTCVGGKWL